VEDGARLIVCSLHLEPEIPLMGDVVADPSLIASVVPYRSFRTADGDILFGGGNDRLFGILAQGLGRPEWSSDERFADNSSRVAHRDILEPWIEEATKTKTTQEWMDIFDGTGLPYAKVNDLLETVTHPHGKYTLHENMLLFRLTRIVLARDMIKDIEHPSCGPMKLINPPVKYSYAKPGIRRPPPTLGQHTDEILKGALGMNEDEVKDLRIEGVVG
jgi:succinate--hydroxymethylglutarate CoA-transferase